MRHPLSEQDRDDLQVALRTIKRIIGVEYPDPPGSVLDDDAEPEDTFRWGIGDGFRLALDGLVASALPGWKSR